MERIKISERQKAGNIRSAREFTLFDDTFMTAVFDGNLECAGYVLSIILGRELRVLESIAQREIRNLKGRSVRLDVRAVDSLNRIYNIEVQREEKGAKPRRARYNGSLMDASCADSGEYGENLPETYVIFITETDYWKRGKSLYDFSRKCIVDGEVLPFDDGLNVIYVNGAYRGDDELGRLMHDFSCPNPSDMISDVLRRHVAPCKSDEGVIKMCRIMEESNRRAVEEYSEERNEEIVLNSLKKDIPVETIADLLGIPQEKVLEIQHKILAEA